MTPLEKQVASALRQTTALWGNTSYTLRGVSGSFVGVFNELSHARAFEDESGRISTYTATIVSEISQFNGTPPSLGNRVTIYGQTFRIVKLDRDNVSVILHLDNTVK
jgi:hypothetical protein